MTARRRLVRVPASSANLGPGYDAMAAAVALHLELEVEETGEYGFETGGLNVPTGRDNLLVRAFESLHSADGITFRLRSEIPLARGLGSSAAAIVAGLVAADHLFELALTREELLARATEIEGHPDNVAAAIYGGFVVCSSTSTLVTPGVTSVGPFAARFDPPEGLEGIVVVPGEEVSTRRAREAIPAELPLADAVANVSAAALLVLGLRSADLDLVGRGLHDRIHQPRRRELYPRSMEIVDAATELGAIGATISGAGPTVLVWTTWEEAGGVATALKDRAEGWAEVRRLPFEPLGADVPEL
jgi:homoserine kinase